MFGIELVSYKDDHARGSALLKQQTMPFKVRIPEY